MKPKKTRKRRDFLFERGAEAFGKIHDYKRPVYVCPICLTGFTREGIDRLTREHAPPKSYGGRVLCLTCADCNSLGGSSGDAALIDHQRLSRIFRGEFGPRDCLLQVDGSAVNATIKTDGETVILVAERERNKPGSHSEFLAKTEELDSSSELQLTVQSRFSQRDRFLGLLRVAYLVLFARLGYRYILRSSLDIVRQQIRNPRDKLIERWWTFLDKDNGCRLILNCSEPFPCFVVAIDGVGALLPTIGSKPPYDGLAILEAEKRMNFNGNPIPWPETMALSLDFGVWEGQKGLSARSLVPAKG